MAEYTRDAGEELLHSSDRTQVTPGGAGGRPRGPQAGTRTGCRRSGPDELKVLRRLSGHEDPLALVRAHLARVPEPPEAVNPATPPVLSRIILRLLEKEPDRRYQSADGLAHDLALLRAAGDHDAPFPLRPAAGS